MQYTHTKKEVIYTITNAAKEYKKRLDGRNFLFIYRDRKSGEIEFFETLFLLRNYQHLTGVEFVDAEGKVRKDAVFFYRKCLAGQLRESENRFKSDGTTPLKSKKVNIKRKIYTEMNYVAKGLPFNKLVLPQELSSLISLENYVENNTKS